LAVPATAAAAPWSPPALVPGGSGAVLPSGEFWSSGVGLIAAEVNKPETLGAAVTGDKPAALRPFSPRLRLFGWALYGRNSLVGVGYTRAHGGDWVQAGFGTVGRGVTRIQTVATGATVATSDIDANARGAAAIAFTKAHGLFL